MADQEFFRCAQIGFLTEWQLYAQKIEGDAWAGEKLDQGKIEKMSGRAAFSFMFQSRLFSSSKWNCEDRMPVALADSGKQMSNLLSCTS